MDRSHFQVQQISVLLGVIDIPTTSLLFAQSTLFNRYLRDTLMLPSKKT